MRKLFARDETDSIRRNIKVVHGNVSLAGVQNVTFHDGGPVGGFGKSYPPEAFATKFLAVQAHLQENSRRA